MAEELLTAEQVLDEIDAFCAVAGRMAMAIAIRKQFVTDGKLPLVAIKADLKLVKVTRYRRITDGEIIPARE